MDNGFMVNIFYGGGICMIVNAKVILKDYVGGGETTGIFGRGSFSVPIGPRCRVTFELENYKNVTLIVPDKIYNGLSVGSTGALEYRRKNFKSFTVGKTVDNNHSEA
jgi:hypothetical protein